MNPKQREEARARTLRGVRGAFAQGGIDRIEIRHVQATGEEARAYVFSGDQISGKGIGPEQITDEIISSIESDADNFPGVSMYGVLFFQAGEHDAPFMRIVLQFKGKADRLARQIEASEPANEKGLVALAMRNANDAMGYAMRAFDLVHRENTELRQMINAHEERKLQVKATAEDLLDRQFERDKSRRRQDVVERGFLNLMGTYGPHLLHKLLPQYVPPPQLVTPPAGSANGGANGNFTANPRTGEMSLNMMEAVIAADISTVLFALTEKEITSVTLAFKDPNAQAAFQQLVGIVETRRKGDKTDRDVVDATLRWAPLVPLDEQLGIIKIAETKPAAVMAALKECNDLVGPYVERRMKEEPQNGTAPHHGAEEKKEGDPS